MKVQDKGNFLTIALPKGRVMKQALKLLAKIGIEPPEPMEESRKLIFEYREKGLKFLVVKPTDVPTYVENGAADIGIAGKESFLSRRGIV